MPQYVMSFKFEAEDDKYASMFMENSAASLIILRDQSHTAIKDLRVSYLKVEEAEHVEVAPDAGIVHD